MGDIQSSVVYLITYLLSNLVLFSVVSTLKLNGRELVYLNDLKSVRQSGYKNTIFTVLALSSAAGLPPFAGFFGKFLVWVSLFEDIYLFNSVSTFIVTLGSIILSLITIFYHMRAMAYLFIGHDKEDSAEVGVVPVFYIKQPVSGTRLFTVQTSVGVLLLFWTIVQSKILYVTGVVGFCLTSFTF